MISFTVAGSWTPSEFACSCIACHKSSWSAFAKALQKPKTAEFNTLYLYASVNWILPGSEVTSETPVKCWYTQHVCAHPYYA